ncbi:hypothetical protein F2Q69_00011045 [Brassica cretica]|uniref:Uncharacterized protein n=1 Tax=Brassica cretica TaxID=69181 RepID=A0A8S9R6P2_BRACR|nr:hypothetical protein F2Q69_00011045 [Brassica cretica]
MAAQVLPNLPGKIICEIIALLGEETFYYLGYFLRAGKRGYALVHEPSVLKMCDITLMVHYVTSQICKGGQFRAFFLKDKEASQVFHLFAAHHADLHSESVLDMGTFTLGWTVRARTATSIGFVLTFVSCCKICLCFCNAVTDAG